MEHALAEILSAADALLLAAEAEARQLSALVACTPQVDESAETEAAAGRAHRELLAALFRRVHSVKSATATAGLAHAPRLAHQVETLLDAVRAGRAALSPEVAQLLADAITVLAQQLDAAIARGAAHEPSAPAEIVAELAAFAPVVSNDFAAAGQTVEREIVLPDEWRQMLPPTAFFRLQSAAREGARVYLAETTFALATFDADFRRVQDMLATTGEIAHSAPAFDAADPSHIGFKIWGATTLPLADLQTQLQPLALAVKLHAIENAPHAATDESAVEDNFPLASASIANDDNHTSDAPDKQPRTVRVALAQIDEIVALAQELAGDVTEVLAAAQSNAKPQDAPPTARRIRRQLLLLGQRLLALRMTPLAATLQRAARAARLAARELGKEIEIEISGGDAQLDASLIEPLADALVHLLRNAVAHGIESPAERAATHKSTRGRIQLTAARTGNQVTLRVADDGRGIDAARITETARRRGWLAADAVLSPAESLRLIFRPGFSTAAKVSAVAGRGVGLDVVEKNIEAIGGELLVESFAGRGTTFEIILPATLALVSALVARCNGFAYALGAEAVVDRLTVHPAELERVVTLPFVKWRGALVPLQTLHALLGLNLNEASADAEELRVVILRRQPRSTGAETATTGEFYALAVTDWDEDFTQCLAHGLGSHARLWRGASGAARLADGATALLLDAARLWHDKDD